MEGLGHIGVPGTPSPSDRLRNLAPSPCGSEFIPTENIRAESPAFRRAFGRRRGSPFSVGQPQKIGPDFAREGLRNA